MSELLTLDAAAGLCDLTSQELVAAVKARRLPARRASDGRSIAIDRADLEKFAGARWHGADNTFVAFANRHISSGIAAQRLPERERIAFHEASHAVTGTAIGLTIRKVTIDAGDGAGHFGRYGGLAEFSQRHTQARTLDELRDIIMFDLSGRVGESVAERSHFDADRVGAATLGLEEWRDGDSLADQAQRLLGRGLIAAQEWLKRETSAQADRAAGIIDQNWTDGHLGGVVPLAWRLLEEGTVTYAK